MLSELQAIAEGLAARLGRAVAIDDPRIHLLVHTPHHGEDDEARRRSIMERQVPDEIVSYVFAQGIERATSPVRIPSQPHLGLRSRVCVPIRSQGFLLGFLWLIDPDESLTDEVLEQAQEAAAAAGLVMHRDRLLVDIERGRDRERLRDLLSEDPTVRLAAAEAVDGVQRTGRSPALRALVVQVASEGTGEEVRQAVEDALERVARRQVPRPALALARGDHGVLVLDRLPRCAADAAQAVRGDLAAALGQVHVRTGLGDPVSAFQHVHESWQQARQALRVAQAVPGFSDDVCWSELGVYQVLVHLPLDRLPAGAVPAALLQLLESDAGRELVRTVEVYLDSATDARATAELLSVHRTSLYYRLGRFQELTSLNLNSGQDRLAVHLGLKLARLSGQL
jgi:hypothetical protein